MSDRRARYLWATYQITLATYDAMLAHGRGGCWICGVTPKPGKNLHVDHDHKTGRVRGLLCWFCNHRLLGRRRENPEHHIRAAHYLLLKKDWRNHK